MNRGSNGKGLSANLSTAKSCLAHPRRRAAGARTIALVHPSADSQIDRLGMRQSARESLLRGATLLLSGEKSAPSHKSIDEELERLLQEKGRQRVIIRDADHGMWFQQPAACRKAVLEFLH